MQLGSLLCTSQSFERPCRYPPASPLFVNTYRDREEQRRARSSHSVAWVQLTTGYASLTDLPNRDAMPESLDTLCESCSAIGLDYQRTGERPLNIRISRKDSYPEFPSLSSSA